MRQINRNPDEARRFTDPPDPWPDFSHYNHRPVDFSRLVLGSRLTADQVAVMESVRDHRITLVPSANSVGKTYGAADVALWWFLSKRPSKVMLVAAPPENNLKVLLWGEIMARINGRPDVVPPGSVFVLRIPRDPEWWMQGFTIPLSAPPHQRQASFSGKHSPNLLTIVDEGDGVPPEIYRAIEQNMSGDNERLLIMYNPKQPSGYIWRLYKDGLANIVQLSALTHPNVISGEEQIPGAVTRSRTIERIQKWSRPLVEGEPRDLEADRSLFTVPAYLDGQTVRRPDGTEYPPLVGGQVRKITDPALAYMTLGVYPSGTYDQLIDQSWIQAAVSRWKLRREIYGDAPPEGIRPRSGQDVAEFGNDFNVIIDRYAGWVAPVTQVWAQVDPTVSAERGADHAKAINPEFHFVDGNGIGASVAPAMRKHGVRQAVSIKTQEKPTREPAELDAEFRIVRDQLWWAVREWLRTDPTAMLPDLPELEDDLMAHTYEVVGKTVRVLTKERVKETLGGRSPDYGDSLALTFAEPEMDDHLPMPGTPILGARRPDGPRTGSSERKRGKRKKPLGGGLSGKL